MKVKQSKNLVKAAHGTQEWAKKTINVTYGCSNDCKYCFAKSIAIRFGRSTPRTWKNMVPNKEAIQKGYRKATGAIMFPSSHDITPENVEECIIVIEKLLRAGNKVLIVSKPDLSCIKSLCRALEQYKDNILFRFTIGAADDKILSYWEPNAPSYSERLKSLRYAHNRGFQTSISCEPILDTKIGKVVTACQPYVTDAIWLGIANQLKQITSLNCPNDPEVKKRVSKLIESQDDTWVLELYKKYKNDPQIKWKDSLKKKLGLTRPTENGLDI